MTIGPGEDLAWGELGDALMERRIELSPRYRNRRLFSEDRQIGYRLVYDVEESRRTNFARPTMLDIARAYEVTGASIERKLRREGELEPQAHFTVPDGLAKDPEPAGEPIPAPPGVADAVAALAAVLVPEVDAQVRRVQMRNPAAAAADIFQDPAEIAMWNIPGYAGKLDAIALLRALRQHRANQELGPVYPRSAK